MKKKKIIIIIAILSVVLITLIILSNSFKETNLDMILSAEYINTDISSEELSLSINKFNNNKPEYVEGEVIVMSNSTSALSSNSIGLKEIDVEKIAVVKAKDSKDMLKSSNKNITNDITISMVSSDKYTTKELINTLKDKVLHVEPNYILHTTDISNDPYLSSQWAIENNGQNAGIRDRDINPITTTSSKEKVIAVVDSGVYYDHPDLQNVMWVNPYENSTDLPGKHGYDFGDNDADPIDTTDGHGTHCAGIIAAESNNNKGITGALLGNSNIKIMALKIKNSDGKMTTNEAIKAYQYISKAIDKGINVVAINNSWGYTSVDSTSVLTPYINEVGAKGALSVCAAGNESTNVENTNMFPATIDSDYIVSVAASNSSDELSDFSNYGATKVDIAAPGSNILSTVPQNIFNPSIYTAAERQVLCSKYEDYNDVSDVVIKRTAGTLKQSYNEYFGTEGENSLEWEIEADETNVAYVLIMPLETTSTQQYISGVIKAISPKEGTYVANYDMTLSGIWEVYYYDDDYDNITTIDPTLLKKRYGINATMGEDTQWTHFSSKTDFAGGSILIAYVPYVKGTHKLYLDDLALSNPSITEDKFGKYEFYDGTSMATPYVTAAAGIISNKYNLEDALSVKQKILQAVRKDSKLKSKVLTGGVLDLSALPTEAAKVPTLDLPTDEKYANWSNVNTIPVQNTEIGKTYQFKVNQKTTWVDCTNNNIVLTDGDGIYNIQVREKDSENISDTYVYKLDTVLPVVTVNPGEVAEVAKKVEVQVKLSDETSGIKNHSVEYIFSTSTTAPTESTGYQVANITNNEATLKSPDGATGTYYLYIKPIEDNASNASDNSIHKYGPYQLKAPIAVQGISLNKSEIIIHEGEVDNSLEATITPNDAENKNIVWSTSDNEILEIDSRTGTFKALKEGKATVIVTTEDGGKTASCNVTVKNAGLNLSTDENTAEWVKPSDIENINEKLEVINTIEGNEYEYSIDEGSNWTLCDYDEEEEKHFININTEGIHKIRIRLKNSSVESRDFIYKLDASRPQITVEGEKDNPDNIKVKVSDEYSGLLNNDIEYIISENDPDTNAQWNKATVNKQGEARLILPSTDGTYNIYIRPVSDKVGILSVDNDIHKYEGYTFDGIIPVQSITLNKDSINLHIGVTDQLEATISPDDATNKNLIWSSSDPSVAIVSDDGLVTAIGKGTATISVATISGGYTDTCDVKVTVPLTGLTLSTPNKTISIGETTLLQLVLTPTDASIKETIWTSDDESIATVENGLVTAISVGTVTIEASVTDEDGNNIKATSTITVQESTPPVVEITEINLNKQSTKIRQGETEKLIATTTPEGVANEELIWTSNNPLVATVSNDGTITAIDKGTTTITVSNEDGTCTDTCEVTVIIPLVDVMLAESINVEKGKTTTLTAILNPTSASINKIEWTTNDESIATVDATGLVTGVSEGVAQISVKVTDAEGTEKTDTCEVTVIKSTTSEITPVTDITLGNTALQLNKNTTQKINLIITPQNADIESIQWNSSNSDIATVDNEGIVTTFSEGETNITVTVTDKANNVRTATCKVKVIVTIEGVSLNKSTLELTIDETEKLLVTINPADVSINSIDWSSSDEDIATVDEEGIVTAQSEGEATITVTVTDNEGNVKTATCDVIVGEQDQEVEPEDPEEPENPEEPEDPTISKDKLPDTGMSGIIILGTIILIGLIISFVKYRNLKDVK